jgi:hypothetical protein
MSYLARLKQRFSPPASVAPPTELTEGASVGIVGRLPHADLEIDACLKRLDFLKRCSPACASLDQWLARIEAAKAFTRAWMPAATQLGWSMAELYSLHPRAPLQRLDAMGAAYCTCMGRVVAVTREGVTVERGRGRLLCISRPTSLAPPAWETFCVATGVQA